MMYKNLILIPVIVCFSFFLGCEIQQASYKDTGVGGTIRDSSTKKGLPGVLVKIQQSTYSTVTDSNGNYYIGKIGVPTSAGNFYIDYEKPGYNPLTLFAILYAGDTTKRINYSLYSPTINSVFTVNDLVVNEYKNKKSYSMLNLYHLYVTDDSIWYNIDALMLGSGTSGSFALYAGGYAQPTTGWDTRFTNLLGYYTQAEFDTLSRIDVGPRAIDPDIDFPTQITQTFSEPFSQSPVYGFYLLGRYNYDPSYPRVYGLLRIDYFYFDNAAGIYKAVIDVKINRNEQNYFLLN